MNKYSLRDNALAAPSFSLSFGGLGCYGETYAVPSQLQNSISAQIRAFAARTRSRRKLPMANRICQFATSASLRQNHRICARKRVLQLALPYLVHSIFMRPLRMYAGTEIRAAERLDLHRVEEPPGSGGVDAPL